MNPENSNLSQTTKKFQSDKNNRKHKNKTMKLTQKTNNKATKSGMTLLELTVVILVLLSLIAILFVGARAWKRGSDRAGCIMNIRNVQQAARGHMNMTNTPTAVPASSDIYGTGTNAYLPEPVCPGGGTYSYSTASATAGAVFLSCSLDTADEGGHVPTGTSTW
jgi:type II secretory pathway pseudopilin PulG